MAVKPVAEGQHTITPHLVVNGGEKALEFYQKAFDAKIGYVHKTPDGKVMHAEITIGDSKIFLADEFPGSGCSSPLKAGACSVILNLYMDGIDKLFEQAVSAGATVTMPLGDQFWGDRYGQLKDPFGHVWALGQHIEDVASDEMKRRAEEAFAHMAAMAKK